MREPIPWEIKEKISKTPKLHSGMRSLGMRLEGANQDGPHPKMKKVLGANLA